MVIVLKLVETVRHMLLNVGSRNRVQNVSVCFPLQKISFLHLWWQLVPGKLNEYAIFSLANRPASFYAVNA